MCNVLAAEESPGRHPSELGRPSGTGHCAWLPASASAAHSWHSNPLPAVASPSDSSQPETSSTIHSTIKVPEGHRWSKHGVFSMGLLGMTCNDSRCRCHHVYAELRIDMSLRLLQNERSKRLNASLYRFEVSVRVRVRLKVNPLG